MFMLCACVCHFNKHILNLNFWGFLHMKPAVYLNTSHDSDRKQLESYDHKNNSECSSEDCLKNIS